MPSRTSMADRTGAGLTHATGGIFVLLMAVMLLCSALAGFRMGSSNEKIRLHRLAFVVVLALTYFMIIDLEYPRVGLINVTGIDAVLEQVRGTL